MGLSVIKWFYIPLKHLMLKIPFDPLKTLRRNGWIFLQSACSRDSLKAPKRPEWDNAY